MEDIILIGSGGHARSIVDCIERQGKYRIKGFIDQKSRQNFAYKQYRVIGDDQDARKFYEEGIQNACIAIGFLGDGIVRDKIYELYKSIGFHFPVIIDPSAIIADDVTIEEGSFIGKNAVINSNSYIGKINIINTGAIVEHDCRVNDFCHISVHATLCGNVSVQDHTFIGAGAVVVQGCTLGNNVIVGANSTILSNVPAHEKALGVYKSI